MTFRDACAKALARAEVAIGDEAELSTGSAHWEKEDASDFTPGRGIEWRLVFGETLDLQVGEHDQWTVVTESLTGQ